MVWELESTDSKYTGVASHFRIPTNTNERLPIYRKSPYLSCLIYAAFNFDFDENYNWSFNLHPTKVRI